MCPEILSIPSYYIFIALGVLVAIIAYRIICGKIKLDDKIYNFYSIVIVVSIAIGFGGAMLFQSFYNYIATGVWVWQGLTFMGGLISGVLVFVAIPLLSGKKKMRLALLPLCEIAVPCLVLAHAFGRIGCFMSGCCHGIESEFGLYFPSLKKTVIPTQLYEAIFLFVLSALLFFITFKNKPRGFNLAIYCFAYGIFRFVIEFFRGDPRGSFIPGISPSQFWSILLIAVGIGLLVLRKIKPQLFEFRNDDTSTNKNE